MYRKVLISVAALSMIGLASAQSLKVDLTVGAETSNIYRGVQLSDKQPSVFGELTTAVQVFKPLDVYASAKLQSVTVNDLKAVARGEVGTTFDAYFVKAKAGYRYNAWFGGDAVRQAAGSPARARDFNSDEAFIGGSVNLTKLGKVSSEYAIGLGGNSQPKDQYLRVGYELPVLVERLTLGVGSSWKKFDATDAFKFNNAEVTANYQVAKKLAVYALASHGGKDVTGRELGNAGMVGVKLTF